MSTTHEVPAGAGRHASLLCGRRLRRRWFLTVTLGEFLGFSIPAAVGAITADAPALLAAAAVVTAGAVEGTLLGGAQAIVLRRALPGLRPWLWTTATAGAATLAYVLGMLPSTVTGLGLPVPPAVVIVLGPVLGVALLLSIGTAQWFVLRRVVRRSAAWIPITAVAWAVGLGVLLGFAMPLWHPGQSATVIAAIGVAGGLLMAATTSAITGEGIRRLLPRTPS